MTFNLEAQMCFIILTLPLVWTFLFSLGNTFLFIDTAEKNNLINLTPFCFNKLFPSCFSKMSPVFFLQLVQKFKYANATHKTSEHTFTHVFQNNSLQARVSLMSGF